MLTTETTDTTNTFGKSLSWTKTLIVATGITSTPIVPTIPGGQDFVAPMVHSSTFGPEQQEFLQDSETTNKAVLDGGKSAYDAVHYAASQGIEVE